MDSKRLRITSIIALGLMCQGCTLLPAGGCPPSVHPRIRDVTAEFLLTRDPSGPYLIAQPLSGGRPLRFPWVPEDAKDLRLSPGGDRLVFAGRYPAPLGGCKSGIALADARRPVWESIWCSPLEGQPPTGVSWSADEAKLAFSFAGNIYTVNMADRKVQLLTRGEWPRWSPTDGRLAFVNDDSIVLASSEALVAQWLILPVKGIIASGVEWTPDGETLSLVHKTAIQPGDSRTSTVLAMLDVKQWQYHDVGTQMWGTSAALRWISTGLKEIKGAQFQTCMPTLIPDGRMVQ